MRWNQGSASFTRYQSPFLHPIMFNHCLLVAANLCLNPSALPPGQGQRCQHPPSLLCHKYFPTTNHLPHLTVSVTCSVAGSTEKASWQDVTGSTPVELCKDIVHFSTKVRASPLTSLRTCFFPQVSGTFWLLVIHDKQREPEAALTLANRSSLGQVPCKPSFPGFMRRPSWCPTRPASRCS